MNVMTEQMKAALEKLAGAWNAEEHSLHFSGFSCLGDHDEENDVAFCSDDPYNWANVCAACLAELVNEGMPPGVMIFLTPEDAADIRMALREYQKDRIDGVSDDVIDRLDAAIYDSFEEECDDND